MAELRLKTIDEAEIETVFGEDFIFEGDFTCDHPVLIKGNLTGTIAVDTDVYIHQAARVHAQLQAETVSVRGTVSGSLKARSRVELFSTGRFQGELECADLLVQSGSKLQGQCQMEIGAISSPALPGPPGDQTSGVSQGNPRGTAAAGDVSSMERSGATPPGSPGFPKSESSQSEGEAAPDSGGFKFRGNKPLDSLTWAVLAGLMTLWTLAMPGMVHAQTVPGATNQEAAKPDALAQWRQGNYQRAVEITLEELSDDPRNLNSYTVLGWALLDLGRYREARDYSLEALQVARYDYRILGTLGEAYFQLGDNIRALQYLQEYVQVRPQGSRIDRVYYLMGEVFMRLEEFHRADIAFTTAVFHNPQSPQWWLRLATARERAENLILAEQAYQEALNRSPSLTEAQQGLQRVQQESRGG